MTTEITVGLGERLLSALIPNHCLLCDQTIPAGRLFCPDCEASLPEKPFLRAIPLEEGVQMSVAAPFPYEGGFRDALQRYKFQGRHRMAKALGLLMAEAAQRFPYRFDAVTYVPLSPKDRRSRGYDQSELLAVQVGRALRLPVRPLFIKSNATATQHDLGAAQRRENVKGAYRCTAKGGLRGMSILLIDDIVTTGSTLGECAKLLYAAGARSVCGLCAASPGGLSSQSGKATPAGGK